MGLLTIAEHSLTGNRTANKTGNNYWTSTPYHFGAIESSVDSTGYWTINYVNNTNGVRVALSLKPGTKFIEGGDGTASNPYEVDMTE